MSEKANLFPRTPDGEIDREKVRSIVRDLLPAYAAGAASPEEARFVAAALPICPEEAQELADYYMLFHLLPSAMPAPEGAPLPVTALLERIARPMPEAETAAARAGTPARRPANTTRPAAARRTPWRAYALVALALLAFGISNVYWSAELARVRRDQELILIGQQQMIEQLQQQLTPETPVTLRSQHRNLTPTTTLEGMQGIFIWSDDERVGTLYVSGMPPLENGRAYQLWLMRDEGTVAASLGVFTVDAQGAATLVFQASEPIASYSDIGISIEPLGGSPTPTTPNVAVASI